MALGRDHAHFFAGGPERTRTSDLRFRKPLLYPVELRDHPAIGNRRRLAALRPGRGRTNVRDGSSQPSHAFECEPSGYQQYIPKQMAYQV